VFLTVEGNIKLGDFGMAYLDLDEHGATEYCGSKTNMAPEMFGMEPYGYPVDHWGYGVVLYEMLFGKVSA
jgi:serine/threonine protein kinase